MSRALPKYDKRRVGLIGGAAAVAPSGAVIAGSALAGESSGDGGGTGARPLAGPRAASCPDVASRLPAIPASARAEVQRNLEQLDTQVREADQRLVDTVGQGGPDFVRNAVLGPSRTSASPPSTASPPPSAAPPSAPPASTPWPPAPSPSEVTGAAAAPCEAPAGAAAVPSAGPQFLRQSKDVRP